MRGARSGSNLELMRRFLGYGLAGWGLEVLFTSLGDSDGKRDRRLRGHSYLWMLPIYGAGGFLLERLHQALRMRGSSRWSRSLAYMAGIYAIEFGSGALLNRLLGDVPWRYTRGLNLRGYVRLDYAPFWYVCGLLFEPFENELRKLDRPGRKIWRTRAAVASTWSSPAREPGPRAGLHVSLPL
jgi:uncharacterized membrane protein